MTSPFLSIDHTKICDLQTGSGVAVPVTKNGATKYYLKGIVALTQQSTEPTECLNSLHLITNITEHEEFLRRNIHSNATTNKNLDGDDNSDVIDLTPAISNVTHVGNETEIIPDSVMNMTGNSDARVENNNDLRGFQNVTASRENTVQESAISPNVNATQSLQRTRTGTTGAMADNRRSDDSIDLTPKVTDWNRTESSFDLNPSPSINDIDLTPTTAKSNSGDRNDDSRSVSNAATIKKNTTLEPSITPIGNATQSLQIRQTGLRNSPPPPLAMETATIRRNTVPGPPTRTTPSNAATVRKNTAPQAYTPPNIGGTQSPQTRQTGVAQPTLEHTSDRTPAVTNSNLENQNSNSLRGGSNAGTIPKTLNFDATNSVQKKQLGVSTPLHTYAENNPSPARTNTFRPTYNPSLVRTNSNRRLFDNYNPSAARDTSAVNPLRQDYVDPTPNVNTPFQTKGNVDPVPVFNLFNQPVRNYPQANFNNIRDPQDFGSYIAAVESRFQQELINERLRVQAMHNNNGYVPPSQVEYYRRALEAYRRLNFQNDPNRNAERMFIEHMAREQFGGAGDPMMFNQNQAPFLPTRTEELHSSSNVVCFNGQCSERQEDISCVNGQCSGNGFNSDNDYDYR